MYWWVALWFLLGIAAGIGVLYEVYQGLYSEEMGIREY